MAVDISPYEPKHIPTESACLLQTKYNHTMISLHSKMHTIQSNATDTSVEAASIWMTFRRRHVPLYFFKCIVGGVSIKISIIFISISQLQPTYTVNYSWIIYDAEYYLVITLYGDLPFTCMYSLCIYISNLNVKLPYNNSPLFVQRSPQHMVRVKYV